MTKKPDLPYLKKKTSKGKYVYWYFRRDGIETRLPDISDPNFHFEYAKALNGQNVAPVKNNFNKLIADYKISQNFTKLSPRTKADYEKVLLYLKDNVGAADPRKMRTSDVVNAMEANRHRMRFANYIQQILSILFEFGKARGYVDDNPAQGVNKFKTGEGHNPWPEPLLEAYERAAPEMDRLIMLLCTETGQRIGDVLEFRWSDIEEGGIVNRQNKTGEELWIPLTPRLADVLSNTQKRGLFIVTNDNGTPMKYSTAENRFRRVRDSINGTGFVMHGWRYTAASRLALAGCTDAEIAAITGHKSLEMVGQYSRKAMQKRLAQQAQGKRG